MVKFERDLLGFFTSGFHALPQTPENENPAETQGILIYASCRNKKRALKMPSNFIIKLILCYFHCAFQVIIYQDTSTILTNNDLFSLLYLALFLRRNRIKASAT